MVGGGLGSRMAEVLASEGFRVALYEKNPKRHVVCGGLVSNETLLENPFLEEYAVHRIDGAVITAGEKELTVERRGVAWVLDRDEMFQGMIERAVAEGATLVPRAWKDNTEQRVLVGADGATSSIRPLVTEERATLLLGYQAEIPWKEDDHLVRVDFGPWSDIFFGWVIPLGNGRAHAGIGLSLNTSGEARERLRSYLKFLGVKARRVRPEGRVIPVSRPLRRVVREDVLLVGDAAVHTKASTGGGIRFGLKAIHYAAPVIVRYLGGEGKVEEFNRIHGKELYPSLKLHWAVHRFYNSTSREELGEILEWAEESGFRERLEKEGQMDDVRSLLTPSLIVRIGAHALRILPELL